MGEHKGDGDAKEHTEKPADKAEVHSEANESTA